MNVTWVAQVKTHHSLLLHHQRTHQHRLPAVANRLAVVDRLAVTNHLPVADNLLFKAVDHIHLLLVHLVDLLLVHHQVDTPHHIVCHIVEAHLIRESLRLKVEQVGGIYSRGKKPHIDHRLHVVDLSPSTPSPKRVTGTSRRTAGHCTILLENCLVTYNSSRARG